MDRVIRRKDGRLTYIASDVAYHKDKFNRPENADKLITILGPDHHGYINRLLAVVAALLERETADRRPQTANVPLQGPDADIYRSPEEREACGAALDEARKRLEVVIFQIVRFVKEGKPAPMRKRDGNIYALIDLIGELGKTMAPSAPEEERRRIGKDVARFFYLMRSHDTHLDFDIDLATKQSDENPVFYAQYAHARICSVMRKAAEARIREQGSGIRDQGTGQLGDAATGQSGLHAAEGPKPQTPAPSSPGDAPHPSPLTLHPGAEGPKPQTPDYALLRHPKELALIKKIVDLPHEVRRCAEDYGVHRLTTYAVELARSYHGFYDNCRVILPEEPELSRARLGLCEAARLALAGVFDLLGISAPERMERE
jgi:arginyl-tRNA synthetase